MECRSSCTSTRGSTGSAPDGFGFGSTRVTLDGFNVFNANQQLVNSYRIASEANAPYATAVPEPATLLLCAIGLAGGYARRRWHHRVKTVAAALIATLGFAGLASADPILRTMAFTRQLSHAVSVSRSSAPVTRAATTPIPTSSEYPPFESSQQSRQIATAHAAYGSINTVVEEIPLTLNGEPYDRDTMPFFGLHLMAEAEFTDSLTISGDIGQGFVQYVISGTAQSYSTNFTRTR